MKNNLSKNNNRGGVEQKEHDKHILNIAKLNSILLALVVVMAFTIGQFQTPMFSDAAIGSLSTETGNWYGGDENGATIKVGKTGNYYIQISGSNGGQVMDPTDSDVYIYGGTGGSLTGIARIEANQTIKIVTYAGGIPGNYENRYGTTGGKAIMVFVDGVPIIGASGGGGAGQTKYDGTAGQSVTTINNQLFSAGAGGEACKSSKNHTYYYAGGAGATMSGCTAAKYTSKTDCSTTAPSGQNYLNTSKCDLVAQPNGGTAVSFKIWFSKKSAEDNPEIFGQMAAAQLGIVTAANSVAQQVGELTNAIETDLKEETTFADTFTVIARREFNEVVNISFDETLGGTSEGIAVINNNTRDGVVKVSGNIADEGVYQVVIDEIVYTINVIAEPTSSNISAVF